jgi:hypothetical protein
MNIIHSVGTPPDRYADRVVSDMLRELARQRAQNTEAIFDLFNTVHDGNPKAQKKLAYRIEKAGAIHVSLKPGKRGKYQICYYDLTGWDIGRDKEVMPYDPVPDDANCWLVAHANMLESLGNGRNEKKFMSTQVLFISKHCLMRMVQRFNVRTTMGLVAASYNILDAVLALIVEIGVEKLHAKEHHIKMTRNATLVVKPEEKRRTLIAATIF